MTVALPAAARRQLPASSAPEFADAARRARGACGRVAMLGGSAGPCGWLHGPLVALDPQPLALADGSRGAGLAALERALAERVADGDGSTGLLVALAFDGGAGTPLRAWSVDSTYDVARRELVARGASAAGVERALDRWQAALETATDRLAEPLAIDGPPASSLPRTAYLDAVERIRAHIRDGEIYQANLCQRFRAAAVGDPFEFFVALASNAGGPHSAYVDLDDGALASISPESFVRVGPGRRVETRPIKGTRARPADVADAADVADVAEDRRRLDELLASPKDHAELLMIVDLERNDLSRVCRPGSVRVRELAAPRSYPTVHHLDALVEGELRDDVGPAALIEAMFPGGSISGAPKRRALELLREVEPVRRGLFTGSLFWFGDDGRIDSSILIRTVELRDGTVEIGAGGGVTWDSDAVCEWRESNDKARAITCALGFDPEQASR